MTAADLTGTSPNQTVASATFARRLQPFFWSVRREIWENRSIYLAPLIVAAVQVVGFFVTIVGLADRRRAVLLLPIAVQRARIEFVYDEVAIMMMLTIFVVGVFYSLDALYGERRERTILFWKSLPVSDVTTVLAKAAIPLVVLPAIAFALIVINHLIMLAITSVTLLAHGLPLTTWAQLPLPFSWLVLFYGLVAIALWHAPIYGWLLFVSAWVRRATFLWAVLPLISISVFERITFGTSYFGAFLQNRVMGFAPGAFEFTGHRSVAVAIDSLAQLTPGRYLATPGLWLGLIVAAGFLAGAVQLRRYRGPL